MISSLWRVLLSSVLLAGLAGFVRAAGDDPAVRDDAGFFSADTVRKADEDILALRKQYKVDLRVETFSGVPADKTSQVPAMTTSERNQLFSTWALDRAKAAEIRGVYILICKNPGHLEVVVGNQTRKQAFTLEDRDKLRGILTAQFKDKEYDKALVAGIDLVRDTLQKNIGPTRSSLAAGEVKDYAGFFSPDAVKKVDTELKSVPRQPGKNLAIETFPTPPPEDIEKVKNMSTAERERYFAGWAAERAKENNFDGLLVLICKQPGHVELDVHGGAARKLFPPAEVGRLRNELLSHFRTKEYDQGLADMIHTLGEKLAPAASVAMAASPAPSKAPDSAPKPAIPSAAEVTSPPAAATAEKPPAMAEKGPEDKSAPDKAQANGVTTAPIANTATARGAAVTPVAKDDDTIAMAKKKVKEAAETKFPTWMWAAGIVGGLFVLWIVIGILRAMFGGGKQGPPTQTVVYQQPVPPANPNVPMQNPGPGYVRPPQAGYPLPPQGGGYRMPTQGANYPVTPQGGYPMGPGPSAPVQQGGGGGGFVSGAIGGAVGAAAGSMMYDALSHRGTQSPSVMGGAPPVGSTASYRSAPPSSTPGSSSNTGDYTTGGDFDTSPATGVAGGGGDFDGPAPAQVDPGAGGDFDSSSPDAVAGGDFDSPGTQTAGNDTSGGDFDNAAPVQPDAMAGGDFGDPSGGDQGSSGGEFGSSDAGGGDMASNDTGGDFGGNDS